ncbi:hypothetical protein LCGC14_1425070 [marine sediment metagenome]|uniref:Uncharacterized protein n=1 Tax=marine sediment metagenome TaxID=412755 RepID=A0A0F9KBC8_9ZZZZ
MTSLMLQKFNLVKSIPYWAIFKRLNAKNASIEILYTLSLGVVTYLKTLQKEWS